MNNTPGAGLGESVIGIRAGLKRVLARVEVVARGRAGRRGLETPGKSHTLPGQRIHVRGVTLTPVTAHIEVTGVIGED